MKLTRLTERTTVTIRIEVPKELHTQLKLKAFTEGITLTRLTLDALTSRCSLGSQDSPNAQPSPPATPVPAEPAPVVPVLPDPVLSPPEAPTLPAAPETAPEPVPPPDPQDTQEEPSASQPEASLVKDQVDPAWGLPVTDEDNFSDLLKGL